jgi:sulfur-carrier protein adenylyltransferase/sulfurtransferase
VEHSRLPQPEALRYSRQMILPEVGEDGQRRLKESRVLCVGAGGLGSPLSLYLAAAGVGKLGIVDFDRVDLTNIHRQILYASDDIGRPKIDAAIERLRALNPTIEVIGHGERLSSANVLELFEGYDVIADGTDNFPTRYLINDACALSGKPDVAASIFRFEAQISVFDATRGPCYRCLFPEPPPPEVSPSCADAGVLGVLPGVAGTMQALEVIKLILGVGEALIGRLLLIDTLAARFREVRVRKDPGCAVCGENPTILSPKDLDAVCGLPATAREPAVVAELDLSNSTAISVEQLQRLLAEGAPIELIDVREPQEYAIAHIDGSRLVPLATLPGQLGRFDRAKFQVVHCHTGVRSAHAVNLMRRAGLRAINLAGGIEAWSTRIDPRVPRY